MDDEREQCKLEPLDYAQPAVDDRKRWSKLAIAAVVLGVLSTMSTWECCLIACNLPEWLAAPDINVRRALMAVSFFGPPSLTIALSLAALSHISSPRGRLLKGGALAMAGLVLGLLNALAACFNFLHSLSGY